MRTWWMVLGALVVATLPAGADEIELKNGQRMQGTVTGFDGTRFTLRTDNGSVQIPRADLVKAVINGGAAPAAAGTGLADGASAGSAAAPAWALVPQGAVAEWALNGNVADTLGRHPGSLRGTGDWQPDRFNQPRGALRFHSRVDETVTVADSSDLKPANLTVTAWIRADKPQRWARIVDKFNYVGKSGFALFHHEQKHVVAFQGFGDGGKEIWVESRSTVGPAWMFVAASYDGRVARMYINGVLEGEGTSNVPLRHNDKALTLGGGFDGSNDFPWSGDLDAVRLFDRALTAEEIRTLFREQDGPLGSSDLMQRDRI